MGNQEIILSERTISPTDVGLIGFFFFNTWLLPAGLLYTTLLAPVLLGSLLIRYKYRPVINALVILLIFSYFQWSFVDDKTVFIRSSILFYSSLIFVCWSYYFLVSRLDYLGHYFNQLVAFNFFMTLAGLVILFIPGLKETFWYLVPMHPALPIIPRLKMLVYEPSFYSFTLAPIWLYYFTGRVIFQRKNFTLGLVLLSFSLIISLSFGVIGGLLIGIVLIMLLHLGRIVRRSGLLISLVYLTLILLLVVALVWYFFPYGPIAERIDKVLRGYDSSANGRTWEAFLLAWEILKQTNMLFGAGLGQIKIAGHEIIVNYYNYDGAWADLVRIPNTMAETLATFGIAGFVFRLLAEIVLFVYTKVYGNFYRMFLFAFLFIYQFTGSYLTNIYEYVMWLIVFLPVFPQFDKKHV